MGRECFYFDVSLGKFNTSVAPPGLRREATLYLDVVSNTCLREVVDFLRERVKLRRYA